MRQVDASSFPASLSRHTCMVAEGNPRLPGPSIQTHTAGMWAGILCDTPAWPQGVTITGRYCAGWTPHNTTKGLLSFRKQTGAV